ncbi:MAG: SDR family NAD(P)-dependent oxidoreductase [Gammaproteobacteria bacterium]|nr:SDR family NAD(P)-dependent oxidoreductase [Gammaproteobacteria bacterium]
MNKTILITGGAGFIGVNSATAFANKGWHVVVVDNLSRRGTDLNLAWLQNQHDIDFEKVDIRDVEAINALFKQYKPEVVLHLAAQVAVTTSVINPREDFEINALGTLNVLEAVRLQCPDTFFINASTNKVYGKMEDLGVVERNGRYEYDKLTCGVPEHRSLDFHSPYGCSKGVADQYTIDYARVYGLRTVTLRQSCIYGPRQFGIEDQGWVAWFTIAAMLNKEITVYGNGKQIRDVLHVEDLIEAYFSVIEKSDVISGESLNIGGGPENTLSLLELLGYLESTLEKKITPLWDDWRPGDQPVFVCDLEKAKRTIGWEPKISVEDGVIKLISWVKDHSQLFE